MPFVLANQMQNVIGIIVNGDQTAYLKGKYMGCYVRLMSDIIHEMSGRFLMLDFKSNRQVKEEFSFFCFYFLFFFNCNLSSNG